MEAITWFISSPFICLGWIIIGALAGGLARRIMGSKNYPFFMDLTLGIAGAIVGGWLLGIFNVASMQDIGTPNGGIELIVFNLGLATAAACLLIYLGRAIRR